MSEMDRIAIRIKAAIAMLAAALLLAGCWKAQEPVGQKSNDGTYTVDEDGNRIYSSVLGKKIVIPLLLMRVDHTTGVCEFFPHPSNTLGKACQCWRSKDGDTHIQNCDFTRLKEYPGYRADVLKIKYMSMYDI